MTAKYPFKNLAFKGGGVKGIAYVGVVEVLDSPEYNILQQIERVAGNSVGSITATLISFRLSAQESIKIFNTLDLSKVPQQITNKLPDWFPGKKTLSNIEGAIRLFTQLGTHSTNYFYDWIKGVIAAQCDGNGMSTFADFRTRSFRDIYIIGTDVSTHRLKIFSADTTPDVAVADAVRMSISIPIFFQGLKFNGVKFGKGDYFADGGLLVNYPIFIFDDEKFEANNPYYENGINWETLGCFLFRPDSCPNIIKPITDIITYIENLIEILLSIQFLEFKRDKDDIKRSIMISNCCVMPTDFNIKPGGKIFDSLVESGKESTRKFLDNYTPPTMTQQKVK